ncbi:MAG: hypothetical protein ACYC7H_13030, partial [Chloroflexota bacterium]
TDETERVREYLIADAQATALETIRQAEAQAAALMHETALQLDVVREQARHIYEHLTAVTRDLQTPVASAKPSATADPATDEDWQDVEGEEKQERGGEEVAASSEPLGESKAGPGAPTTPPQTSQPLWVIDLRSPSAKPPDQRDDPPSDLDTANGPRGEVAADQSAADAAAVEVVAAPVSAQDEVLPLGTPGGPSTGAHEPSAQPEPTVASTQPPRTGADRVFELQSRNRSDMPSDPNANAIKRMLSH